MFEQVKQLIDQLNCEGSPGFEGLALEPIPQYFSINIFNGFINIDWYKVLYFQNYSWFLAARITKF